MSVLLLAVVAGVGVATGGKLSATASTLKTELESARDLFPALQADIAMGDRPAAASTISRLTAHTNRAREAAEEPLWTAAGLLPFVGPNFRAATEVATSADDVARLGAAPLVGVLETLDWSSLAPVDGEVELQPLISSKPKISAAAHAVRQTSDRLDRIDASELFDQVSAPLVEARSTLKSMRDELDAAASVAEVAPDMMGSVSPRRYLLLIQNNAEARATGGIPGALAVLTLDKGKFSLSDQTSSAGVGVMVPPLAVDPEQLQIYSARLGKYMQDVNLTPDFPTAGGLAQAMWKTKTGEQLDGVLSIDPVALSYILAATGPVDLLDPHLGLEAGEALPTELTAENVVQTLLSDVYARIPDPGQQDLYFANAAKEIFGALSNGATDPKKLMVGLTRGVSEGRVLAWSAHSDEQSVIAGYPISGAVHGPSVAPAQFGVYLNDGTGAKMDYYVKRTVQLVKECDRDGYEETTVRVTSTNTAPTDAATLLPSYVTGEGQFGVPSGSVQTNIVAYGPAQANVEMANLDGQRTEFAPYLHGDRPVGVLAIRLAPGESKTVEFTFGKIVQHTEPTIVVTPTVQPVTEVTLPTKTASCP